MFNFDDLSFILIMHLSLVDFKSLLFHIDNLYNGFCLLKYAD